jgi:hypothetical protein
LRARILSQRISPSRIRIRPFPSTTYDRIGRADSGAARAESFRFPGFPSPAPLRAASLRRSGFPRGRRG